MKYKCPKCGEKTISIKTKLWGSFYKQKCPHCGVNVFNSAWINMGLGGILIVFNLIGYKEKALWPYVIEVILLIVLFLLDLWVLPLYYSEDKEDS